MAEYEDKMIPCMEPGCGDFKHSSADQRFYDRMGFTKMPRRCKKHRDAMRLLRDAALPTVEQPKRVGDSALGI